MTDTKTTFTLITGSASTNEGGEFVLSWVHFINIDGIQTFDTKEEAEDAGESYLLSKKGDVYVIPELFKGEIYFQARGNK